ncbi:hypothetical protein SAMN05421874_12896 [Nonomuraea maritima]|uniref:Uncharacterized protein n=1 Tax=Nonomuraea maritima TaxID=683260 RepID=A0A1G9MLX1_9ACTN|nr:hypothetical protein SAMN05421874_12896 [Nonomuraea maritima]
MSSRLDPARLLSEARAQIPREWANSLAKYLEEKNRG